VEIDERRILMKTVTRVLTFLVVTLAVIAMVGCGVSKEEHEKAVSELSKTKAELAQANTKMAAVEKSLSEAQAKLKSQAMQPPAPAEKPATAEKPAAVDTGMQDMLAASQKEAADLRAKVDSLTGENANLKGMLDKLKAEYAEIQKKLGGGVPGVQAPAAQVPATPAAPQVPGGLPKKP
jgi:predicted nuclease with TOPRIM domain